MEDVVAPTFLPVFGEVKMINLFGNSGKIILNKEDNQKLEAWMPFPNQNHQIRAHMPRG